MPRLSSASPAFSPAFHFIEAQLKESKEAFGQWPLQVNSYTDIHESLEGSTAHELLSEPGERGGGRGRHGPWQGGITAHDALLPPIRVRTPESALNLFTKIF